MKLLLGAAAAAALLAGAPAMAQTAMGPTQVYGNIGFSTLDGGGEEEANLSAVTGRIGGRFSPYLGVEGQASFGVGSEEVDGIDINLENELSAYVVGFLPVAPNADLIGRIGFGRAEIAADAGIGEVSVDGSGLAFGVGGQYFFDGLNGIRLDYTRQQFENEDEGIEDGDIDAFTISYARKF